MAGKSKGNADVSSSGKRKRDGDDQYGYRKRIDMSLADESSSSGDDYITDDVSLQNDFGSYLEAKAEPKTPTIPYPPPKAEEMDEEDPKKFMEDRYKSFRSKYGGVSVGSWARVKRGKYMGDLAQVVNVNEFQMKATVKLLPRLDLQSVAAKSRGGFTCKYTSPPPRLITSRELDAYRSRVRSSLDPDTGDLYEVFDGMKLKDGYVFKKLALDSLGFSNCKPSEAELIKFSPGKKDESSKKKIQKMDNDKGGEGSSSSDMDDSFEVSDLVIHANTFGVVIGREKDGRIKVLEEGSERPMVVVVEARSLKKSAFGNTQTTIYLHNKIISVNDTVRVFEGPLEGKRGIVKQIYKGVVFLHDENEQENCGYFCAKAQICEKMDISADIFYKRKGGKSGASIHGIEAVDYAGLPEASFVEKLRRGAQELCGLMEEAASRCLGRASVEDQLRSALMELESCKERVSAVEAERDNLSKRLEQERAKIISAFGKLLNTDFHLVTRMKKDGITLEDLPTWCARYKSSSTADF